MVYALFVNYYFSTLFRTKSQSTRGQPAFSNPGSIGNSSLPSACQPTVSRKSQRNKESKQKYTRNHQSSKDIWDEKEVETEEHTTTQEDGRPEPKYLQLGEYFVLVYGFN